MYTHGPNLAYADMYVSVYGSVSDQGAHPGTFLKQSGVVELNKIFFLNLNIPQEVAGLIDIPAKNVASPP